MNTHRGILSNRWYVCLTRLVSCSSRGLRTNTPLRFAFPSSINRKQIRLTQIAGATEEDHGDASSSDAPPIENTLQTNV